MSNKKVIINVIGLLMFVCNSVTMATNIRYLPEPDTKPTPKLSSAQELLILQDKEAALEYQLDRIMKSLVEVKVQIAAINRTLTLNLQANNGFSWINSKEVKSDASIYKVDSSQSAFGICQAYHAGYLYPGMITAKGCVVTYAGRAYTKTTYNVLIATVAGYWQAGNKVGTEIPYIGNTNHSRYLNNPVFINANTKNYVPSNSKTTSKTVKVNHQLPKNIPVFGGYERGHYVYICRVNVDNRYYVGKVVKNNCNFALKNKEIFLPVYEVLLPKKP
ncbi:MAG: DUF3421 domain-containing protein [Gammaproteobacteria bacterium]|nr:MAG: DUF3421 domain-containing protein [Gammaproteobacteria bacterium]UTW42950.1 DUF3421 domain-containing protein [bacterium SCSIO 12844]